MGYSLQLAHRDPLPHPTVRIVHITAFGTLIVKKWLEQGIAQWVHQLGLIQRFMAPCERSTTELHPAPTSHTHFYHTLLHSTFHTHTGYVVLVVTLDLNWIEK